MNESFIECNGSSVITIVCQGKHHNGRRAVCCSLRIPPPAAFGPPSVSRSVVQQRTGRAGCNLEDRYVSGGQWQLCRGVSSRAARPHLRGIIPVALITASLAAHLRKGAVNPRATIRWHRTSHTCLPKTAPA
jgi:hypothetical protein